MLSLWPILGLAASRRRPRPAILPARPTPRLPEREERSFVRSSSSLDRTRAPSATTAATGNVSELLSLTPEEKAALDKSAAAVKELVAVIGV